MKKEEMMKNHPKGKEITTVDCSISAGMFKSERMISVELPGGREITTLVDRHQVIPDREVSPSEEYKGQVKVTVLEVKNNSALIDLPQPGITQGTRLMVPKEIIKTTR
jgi:hypothetical protein